MGGREGWGREGEREGAAPHLLLRVLVAVDGAGAVDEVDAPEERHVLPHLPPIDLLSAE